MKTRMIALLVLLAAGVRADLINTIVFQDGLSPWADSPMAAYEGTEDTHIKQDGATTNYGANTTLLVRDRNNDDDALIRFRMVGVTNYIHSATITNASLSFRNSRAIGALNANTNYNRVDLFLVNSTDGGWAETQATWNLEANSVAWNGGSGTGASANRSRVSLLGTHTNILSTVLLTGSVTNTGSWVTFDFTQNLATLESWLAGGANGGFVVVAYGLDHGGDGPFVTWHSSESATDASRPILTLNGTFDVEVVPEPSALALLGIGLALVARRLRAA